MSNNDQDEALRVAACDGDLEAAQQALNNGANINAKDPSYPGNTPLHYASGKGHEEVVSWLLENGANVHVTNKYGCPPLHYACCYGHETICSLLLQQNGAKHTINARENTYGDTPLHYACLRGDASICLLLLQNGADANIANSEGKTPRRVAREGLGQSCADVISQFLQQQEMH